MGVYACMCKCVYTYVMLCVAQGPREYRPHPFNPLPLDFRPHPQAMSVAQSQGTGDLEMGVERLDLHPLPRIS